MSPAWHTFNRESMDVCGICRACMPLRLAVSGTTTGVVARVCCDGFGGVEHSEVFAGKMGACAVGDAAREKRRVLVSL